MADQCQYGNLPFDSRYSTTAIMLVATFTDL